MKAIRRSLDCFNLNGMSISLQRKFRQHVYTKHKLKRVLVVSFSKADMNYETYLEQANLISTTDGYYLWLNIYQKYNASSTMEKQFLESLSSSAINLALDMVVAVEMPKPKSLENSNDVKCQRNDQVASTGLENQNVEMFLPFNHTKIENDTEYGYFKEFCNASVIVDISYCILQVYKIRKSENSSMVVCPLGYWHFETGTQELKPFQFIERRKNFRGYPIVFGKKKFSQESSMAAENLIEDDNDEENMDKILEYIIYDLNARMVNAVFLAILASWALVVKYFKSGFRAVIKMYPTLGLKGASGNWSGLLGAVVSQEVDLGVDSVIKVPERYHDMSFSQNIMLSIRNIYLKPEESHTARDIYLQPFKSQLLFCVLATGIIFATIMSVYIFLTYQMEPENHNAGTSYSAISDAVLWSFSVISMQGSSIKPKSYSGNLIVVISLLFALIIYNSYSAFITSILSVKLTEIRSVNDLLESDYDIGYTKNSQDEIFLRSMNNESQLNQIYLRGYLHNNINNITDGLVKATEGNYGFFATRHIARKQILKISGYRCRYDIMEIPVKSTQNSVAFPMARKSPYRKLINMCLIKMTESGIHDYIGSLIEPDLPSCEKQKAYQSAGITDITTSFILLGIGLILGTLVIVAETFWKNKKIVYTKLKRRVNGLNSNAQWVQ